MDHPNVSRILGSGCSQFYSKGEEQGEAPYIVSELAVNGDLFDYLSLCGSFDDRQTRQIFG